MSEENTNQKTPIPSHARRKRAIESDHWWDRQHSLVLRQTPRWAQSFAITLMVLASGAITAGFVIRIDEVVTLKGKLEPSAGALDVKTPAGGLISNVYVKNGAMVTKGQLLVKFDTRNASGRIDSYKEQIQALELNQNATLASLQSRKETLQRNYETSIDILERMKPLLESGAVDYNMVLEKENVSLDLKARAQDIDKQISMASSENKRRQSQLKVQLSQAILQQQYENVKAPINGVVFQLKAVEQGVLGPSEPILKIIPQDGLNAQVYITNKDVGFIKVGQAAEVRVDAFGYTRFGTIPATVKSIGADVLPPDAEINVYRFPATLSLSRSYLNAGDLKIPMKSGYAITANVRLRDKRLITLVSDMFTTQFESLKSLRQ